MEVVALIRVRPPLASVAHERRADTMIGITIGGAFLTEISHPLCVLSTQNV
jgi:hypothetical protein